MLSSISVSSASFRQTWRSPAARRWSISAYSICSGLGDNAPLAQRAIDHRALDLRTPPNERLVHHDHIDRDMEVSQRMTKFEGLCETVLNFALDYEEVKVAALVGVAAGMGAKQDHLGRGGRSIDQRTAGTLYHLGCGDRVHP